MTEDGREIRRQVAPEADIDIGIASEPLGQAANADHGGQGQRREDGDDDDCERQEKSREALHDAFVPP